MSDALAEMRAICNAARFTAPKTGDGERLHLDVWFPSYPEPVVVLTSSKHIEWGAALSPAGARELSNELRRAADECDRARAASSEAQA